MTARAVSLSVVLSIAFVAAGCGGGSSSPNVTTKFASALSYSRCMRAHGVAKFPDPTQIGGGIQISGSQGMNPQSPAFKSAQQTCRHLLPNGGEPTHTQQQQAIARLLHTSRCMRAHGIAGFPDPTLSAPTDRAGYGAIMSNGGAWLAVPSSIDVHSSAYEHAAAACNLGSS